MNFSPSQQRALAIAPYVTAPCSMLGSAFIIKSVLSDPTPPSPTYQRILLGMSCTDFLVSFWFALSTTPAPEATPGIWGASGTTATCTAQGFFLQLSIAIPLYNAALSIYYLLVSRYMWKEEHIRRLAEPFMHTVALSLPLATAIISLPLKLFNHADVWCWIAPFPVHCKNESDSEEAYDEGTECLRGKNAWVYEWAFIYGPIWTCIVISMTAMIMVYWTVLQQERAVDKFQEDGLALRRQSKRVAWQAFWYLVAFYVTWVPGTITKLLRDVPQIGENAHFVCFLLKSIFLPMQGFLNFIVYVRSRYLKFRRENPFSSPIQAIGHAAFSMNRTLRGTSDDPGINMTSPSNMPTHASARVPTEAILRSELQITSGEQFQETRKVGGLEKKKSVGDTSRQEGLGAVQELHAAPVDDEETTVGTIDEIPSKFKYPFSGRRAP